MTNCVRIVRNFRHFFFGMSKDVTVVMVVAFEVCSFASDFELGVNELADLPTHTSILLTTIDHFLTWCKLNVYIMTHTKEKPFTSHETNSYFPQNW